VRVIVDVSYSEIKVSKNRAETTLRLMLWCSRLDYFKAICVTPPGMNSAYCTRREGSWRIERLKEPKQEEQEVTRCEKQL